VCGWGVCGFVGVVGGVIGATRFSDLVLLAIDTDILVAIGQGWPLFEARSRFAGSSGGSSPMVCGLLRVGWGC